MSGRRSLAGMPAVTGRSPDGRRRLMEDRFDARRMLLTTSCTAALEIAALLCDLRPGDEVIVPSFTFVSTANAIVLRGANPIFVDIRPDTLNIDERLIEAAITPRTRAIFPVHYAGIGCEMDEIMAIARRHNLLVVEDAAQGVFAKYKDQWLGTIGHMGCYSFHETKNFSCGEGGALTINDPDLEKRGRDTAREGHQPQPIFARAGRQIHVGRHRLFLHVCPTCWRLSYMANWRTWRRSQPVEAKSSTSTQVCSHLWSRAAGFALPSSRNTAPQITICSISWRQTIDERTALIAHLRNGGHSCGLSLCAAAFLALRQISRLITAEFASNG